MLPAIADELERQFDVDVTEQISIRRLFQHSHAVSTLSCQACPCRVSRIVRPHESGELALLYLGIDHHCNQLTSAFQTNSTSPNQIWPQFPSSPLPPYFQT